MDIFLKQSATFL